MTRIFRSFVLILLCSLSHPSSAQTTGPGLPSSLVTVRIYDYTGVPPSILAQAIVNARYVFEDADLQVGWLEQPVSPSTGLETESSNYVGPTDLLLRILPREQARRFHPNPAILGVAHLSGLNGRAAMASVFFHRIENLSKAEGLQQGSMLGHVLAHEAGHLLLGRGRHARAGLMRCPWGKRELKEAARGRLRLSVQEIRRIRRGIRDRVRVRRLQLAEQAGPRPLVAEVVPKPAW